MHSPRGHSSENGLGVFQLGVTPFAYNTLRKINCFYPPFVIHT
jgi:hypothetical protein